ncbi:MAG: acyl carrier protein phosphodiesterase [Saprospiraceae bacterium]|nr:acyl carrier protein phosphodiesterase [Saprospiraceae bacterium]
MYLSCRDDQLFIGNFLGDLLNLRETRALPAPIMEGVTLHRAIDSFTDSHPKVLAGKKVLYPAFGKYASVALDIFFDYLLAKNWKLYSEEALESFIEGCYVTLEARKSWIPEKVHPRVEGMLKGRFLHQYIDWPGLERTFKRVQHIMSHPEYFENPIPPLREHEAFLNEMFLQFFPDLDKHVQQYCDC